jgi:hypothetical protein
LNIFQRCISQPLSSTNEIADRLGKTFSPSCEVVAHDVLDAEHVIVRSHNNLPINAKASGDPGWRLRAYAAALCLNIDLTVFGGLAKRARTLLKNGQHRRGQGNSGPRVQPPYGSVSTGFPLAREQAASVEDGGNAALMRELKQSLQHGSARDNGICGAPSGRFTAMVYRNAK